MTASLLAVASKYILALNRKHIFNPAAIAVAITALAFNQAASWWVGTAWMMPFVFVGGVLIVRKIRRANLVWAFLIVATISILGNGLTRGLGLASLPNLFERILLDTPLFFFAFIMLTEPLTTPPSRGLRIWYGVIVGALFAPWVPIDLPFVGAVYATPELALVVGNVFSYAVSPKRKLLLTLKEKVPQTPDVYDFVFTTETVGKKAVRLRSVQFFHSNPANIWNGRWRKRLSQAIVQAAIGPTIAATGVISPSLHRHPSFATRTRSEWVSNSIRSQARSSNSSTP